MTQALVGLLALVAPKPLEGDPARLIETLRTYVSSVVRRMDSLPTARRSVLDQAADYVSKRLESGSEVNLVFVCSTNSCRSHMSQTWALTAAHYYGLDRLRAFSGGAKA